MAFELSVGRVYSAKSPEYIDGYAIKVIADREIIAIDDSNNITYKSPTPVTADHFQQKNHDYSRVFGVGARRCNRHHA